MRMGFCIELLSLADNATREIRIIKIKLPVFEFESIRTRVFGTEERAENDIGRGNR
jgi:hypothetical protein